MVQVEEIIINFALRQLTPFEFLLGSWKVTNILSNNWLIQDLNPRPHEHHTRPQ